MIAPSLLVLLAASVAGFQFFVERQDGSGLCITNERKYKQRDLLPFFQIGEKGVLPLDEEHKWTDGWHVRNLKIKSWSSPFKTLNQRVVSTDGSARFKSVAGADTFPRFLVLASNATLLWSEHEDWRQGRTFRVHLGQPNWAELCTDRERCQRLHKSQDKTEGEDVLMGGRQWRWLQLFWNEVNLTLSTDYQRTLLQWGTKDASSFEPRFLFARTDSAPGVFLIPLVAFVEPFGEKNEMRRSFSVQGPSSLQLCLEVLWQDGGHAGHFRLKNSSGAVVRQGQLEAAERADGKWSSRLDFLLDHGGEFQLSLLDLKKSVQRVAPCAAEMKVWRGTKGCLVHEGRFTGFREPPTATLLSAQLNSSISVDLTQGQMVKVCLALGVRPGDKEELLFSGAHGASTRKCT